MSPHRSLVLPLLNLLSCLPQRVVTGAFGAAFLAAVLGAGACFAQGTLDQANAPAAWTGGASNIIPANHAEQTFAATLACLTRVEVGLMTGNRGRGGDQVTLKVLDWTDLTAPKELASVSASIPEGFDGFWSFTMPGAGVKIPTGGWVALLLQDSGKNIFWWKYQTDNPYPGGNRFFAGTGDNRFDYLFKTYGTASCQPFTLSVTPDPVNLATGGSQPVTVGVARQGGFSGVVTVTLSLPSGVSATPAGLAISGASGTMTLVSSATAPTGSFTASANGNASGAPAAQKSFKINIAAPSGPRITAVTPSVQQKGGSITVTGTGFNANCGLNTVRFAGVSVVPTACAAGSLTAPVPPQAGYGATQLTVATGAQTSNALALTVGRQSGNFTEISGDVLHQHASRTCAAGTVKLNVVTGSAGSYTASFQQTASGKAIGSSIAFFPDYSWYDTGGVKYTIANLGGAGFSLCSVGLVLNANNSSNPLLTLRDLDRTSDFQASPYTVYIRVPNLPAPYSETYEPRLFRSPDGTIILAVAAAAPVSTSNLTAAFFDKETSGQMFKSVSLTRDLTSTGVGGYTVSASLTSANQIVLTFGSHTLAPINIP